MIYNRYIYNKIKFTKMIQILFIYIYINTKVKQITYTIIF